MWECQSLQKWIHEYIENVKCVANDAEQQDVIKWERKQARVQCALPLILCPRM